MLHSDTSQRKLERPQHLLTSHFPALTASTTPTIPSFSDSSHSTTLLITHMDNQHRYYNRRRFRSTITTNYTVSSSTQSLSNCSFHQQPTRSPSLSDSHDAYIYAYGNHILVQLILYASTLTSMCSPCAAWSASSTRRASFISRV